MKNAIQTADEIINMMVRHGGNEYAGERVTQLQHMYQTAQLAMLRSTDEELILAAFLHDLGHICVSDESIVFMGDYGTMDHETIGACFLEERGFSSNVVQLVGSHVAAKRYLTFSDPSYYDQLSEASKETLRFQGGPMSSDEAELFEANPLFEDMLRLRFWDEAAKDADIITGDLGVFRTMIVRHLIKSES